MDKTFNPQQIEQQWYQIWETNGYFSPHGSGKPFCIMLPPPNVTGRLHMGHGFQQTIMDTLTRYHRMCGDKTLWQPGTDHAGISTQMVVEAQLNKDKKSRHDLGRKAFIEKVWQWKESSGDTITKQMRRIGTSVDWSRERFTMDDVLSKAVMKVFIDLYDEGLIYRGKRLVNWDPVLLTAISDLEVISEEEQGSLWHIRYPLTDSDDYLVIATTRPETMLADVAVAVHPDDQRYQHLIGKMVKLPLTQREIPIIADDYVDPEFGSGCVKITPAHDFNDYNIGKRHDLPFINILTHDAHMNDNVPQTYRGLERYQARKKILKDLDDLSYIDHIQDHRYKIPRGEKSGAVVEPYLTDQWFVRIAPLAQPAIDAVKAGKVKFIPENWNKTYFQWMENIEDWCISRQLWWGHRIPAWYDDNGNIYVGEDEKQIRRKYKLNANIKLEQDHDVLDTWFSSALWPFSTLGWPEKTPEFKTFYPSSVLVTGFDIIFFWVARMIMMGLKFIGDVPFKQVYIHGLIRDAEGKKMSKSKGNVLDPLDLIDGIDLEALVDKRTRSLLMESQRNQIEKQTRKEFPDGIAAYGTDALRFTYCALASTGRDIRFDMQRIEGYRNFCNKLWNAARYVIMNTEEEQSDLGDGPIQMSPADRWVESRLQHTIAQVHKYYQTFRFDLLANELYEFVWHEYCDWYLELSKPVLYGENSTQAMKRGTRLTLLTILETILRLLHPIMPFITEEIWQKISKLVGKNAESVSLERYPTFDETKLDNTVETDIEWVKQVVDGVRNIRGEMNIAPGKLLPIYFNKGQNLDKIRLDHYYDYLINLAKLESITWLKPTDQAPACATALAGEMEVLIPMSGLIDTAAETQRLSKEIEKRQKELTVSKGKLDNPNFTDKAPEAVVEKERQKVTEIESAISKLEAQLQKIRELG